MSTKNSYLVKKSWKQRREGLFKKGDEIREKFNARVVIYIDKDDEKWGYMSHKDGWIQLPPISLENLKTPNDFITVAQQQRRPLSQTLGAVASDTSESSGMNSSQPNISELKPQTPPDSVKSPESRQLLRDYFTGPSFSGDGESESLQYFA